MKGYGYSIRRDGQRWIVLKGWEVLSSWPSKAEAQEWIEFHKLEYVNTQPPQLEEKQDNINDMVARGRQRKARSNG